MPTPQVLYPEARPDGTTALVMQYPLGRGVARGATHLRQTVHMVLLTTPGSDRYEPDLGGGLMRIMYNYVEKPDLERAAGELAQVLTRTKASIFRSQVGYDTLPPAARLADLTLGRIEEKDARLHVQVHITSEAGQTQALNF